MESVQYNFTLNMTGSIRGTSVEKIYQELGLESLPKRRWYRKLSHSFRLFKGQFREYLFKILTSVGKGYIQELIITFPTLVLNVIFIEILLFHQLLLNGTT